MLVVSGLALGYIGAYPAGPKTSERGPHGADPFPRTWQTTRVLHRSGSGFDCSRAGLSRRPLSPPPAPGGSPRGRPPGGRTQPRRWAAASLARSPQVARPSARLHRTRFSIAARSACGCARARAVGRSLCHAAARRFGAHAQEGRRRRACAQRCSRGRPARPNAPPRQRSSGAARPPWAHVVAQCWPGLTLQAHAPLALSSARSASSRMG